MIDGAHKTAHELAVQAESNAMSVCEALDGGVTPGLGDWIPWPWPTMFSAGFIGLKPGTVHMVCAATGGGKTSFMLDLAYRVACGGHPVSYLSMEIRHADMAHTLVARASRSLYGDGAIPEKIVACLGDLAMWSMVEQDMRTKFPDQDLDPRRALAKIAASREKLESVPLKLAYVRGITADKAMAMLERDMREGVKMVCIDHVALLRSGPGFSGKKHDMMREFIQAARDVAERYRAAVVVAQQLKAGYAISHRQDGQQRLPTIDDARESHGTTDDADSVIMLHRVGYGTERQHTSGVTKVVVTKARTSLRRGVFDMKFLPRGAVFEDGKGGADEDF